VKEEQSASVKMCGVSEEPRLKTLLSGFVIPLCGRRKSQIRSQIRTLIFPGENRSLGAAIVQREARWIPTEL
jgi:hypothetical protein